MNNDDFDDDVHLLWVGLIVEGGLIFLGLLLGWFGFYDHRQPLNKIDSAVFFSALAWGIVWTVPLLGFLVILHFCRPKFLQPMRDFVEQRLHPIFRSSTLLEMAILSVLAGLGEELLFRWCLQGGIMTWLEPQLGLTNSTLIGLVVASTLFGLCHWVSASYGWTTLVVGLFLGSAMIWSGTFLVPAVAHALYDFVAMVYVARIGMKMDSE